MTVVGLICAISSALAALLSVLVSCLTFKRILPLVSLKEAPKLSEDNIPTSYFISKEYLGEKYNFALLSVAIENLNNFSATITEIKLKYLRKYYSAENRFIKNKIAEKAIITAISKDTTDVEFERFKDPIKLLPFDSLAGCLLFPNFDTNKKNKIKVILSYRIVGRKFKKHKIIVLYNGNPFTSQSL